MITTFREAQCLLMLYKACPDPAIRARALDLVPELGDLVDTAAYEAPRARRRRLTAHDGGLPLGHAFVVCRDDDLEEHKRDFGLSFDLATAVSVTAEDA